MGCFKLAWSSFMTGLLRNGFYHDDEHRYARSSSMHHMLSGDGVSVYVNSICTLWKHRWILIIPSVINLVQKYPYYNSENASEIFSFPLYYIRKITLKIIIYLTCYAQKRRTFFKLSMNHGLHFMMATAHSNFLLILLLLHRLRNTFRVLLEWNRKNKLRIRRLLFIE